MPGGTTANVVQFCIAVTGVAVISKVTKDFKLLDSASTTSMLTKGFLTFFAAYLTYYPVSLMLRGTEYRNFFFNRR